MAEAQMARRDIVGTARDNGWEVESNGRTDEFTKDGVTIQVEYKLDHEIRSLARSGGKRRDESFGSDSPGKTERLRIWLEGAASAPAKVATSVRRQGTAPRLSWSREKWLNRTTHEIVEDTDPRVPRTVEAMKKQKTWHMVGFQANTADGYYRGQLDMNSAAGPTLVFSGTWNPTGGPPELLLRGSHEQVYNACVRHHQGRHGA